MCITIVLKSFDQSSINAALEALMVDTTNMSEHTVSHYRMPISSKTYTLLRSPHGHKESRESLSLNTYKAVVQIHIHNNQKAWNTLSRFTHVRFYGVQMQIIWTQTISLRTITDYHTSE